MPRSIRTARKSAPSFPTRDSEERQTTNSKTDHSSEGLVEPTSTAASTRPGGRPRQFLRFRNHFYGFENLTAEERLHKHKAYVAEHHGDAEDYEAGSYDDKGDDSELDFGGQWIIECPEITGQWGYTDLRLTVKVLDPSPGEYLEVGVMEFGVLEGVMHFLKEPARHSTKIGSNSRVSRKDAESLQLGVDELRGEVADIKQQMAALCKAISSSNDLAQLRTQAVSIYNNIATGKKRPRDDDGASAGASAKKPKLDPLHRNLVWRGRETGENEIQCNDKTNVGFIDFTDDRCVEFHGEFGGNLVGGAVAFSGYKISSSSMGPDRRTDWESYSKERYEEERVARWR